MICLKELKEKGFSDKLIRELLPEPTLKTNPKYKCAPKMKLWEESDVEQAMCTDAFKEYQIKRAKRQAAAQKAVETKVNNLVEQTKEAITKIKVRRISMQGVRSNAISERRRFYEMQADMRGYSYDYPDPKYANEDTITRWMVNYIRHNLTKYDENLEEIAEKTGKTLAYVMIRNAILDKIAEVYPELAEECENQKIIFVDEEEAES